MDWSGIAAQICADSSVVLRLDTAAYSMNWGLFHTTGENRHACLSFAYRACRRACAGACRTGCFFRTRVVATAPAPDAIDAARTNPELLILRGGIFDPASQQLDFSAAGAAAARGSSYAIVQFQPGPSTERKALARRGIAVPRLRAEQRVLREAQRPRPRRAPPRSCRALGRRRCSPA